MKQKSGSEGIVSEKGKAVGINIEKVKFLKNIPFFTDIDSVTLEKIAKIVGTKYYRRGETIFYEGDPGAALYIVRGGKIKIVKLSEDGREKILAILGESDYFGEMAIIEREPRSATVVAQDDAEVLVLYQQDFQELLRTTPKVMLNIIKTLCLRLRATNQQIEELVFRNVRVRLASSLITLAEKHGIKQKSGIEINLKLTHQDMANIVGASRELVTKILNELEDVNLIKVFTKKILITNFDGLVKERGFSL